MSYLLQFRNDTAANWTAVNPTLATGEPGFETDTTFFKIGDGTTAWADLPYKTGSGGTDEPSITEFNNQTSTAYTLVLSDKNKIVTLANSSSVTLTVPTNSAEPFDIGTTISIMQAGAGQVTIVGAAGVDVRSTPGFKLRAQWSNASLYKWKTNEWILSGDTTL
jgi:hypothetical protein